MNARLLKLACYRNRGSRTWQFDNGDPAAWFSAHTTRYKDVIWKIGAGCRRELFARLLDVGAGDDPKAASGPCVYQSDAPGTVEDAGVYNEFCRLQDQFKTDGNRFNQLMLDTAPRLVSRVMALEKELDDRNKVGK